MTDYAIRINIEDKEHYDTIKKVIQKYSKYLIGPIEIGEKTNKEHIHIYIQTTDKKDTMIKYLKRNKVIYTGNGSYSCSQITHRQPYKDYTESLKYYLAYCIKTVQDRPILLTQIINNININQLPKWEHKQQYIKKKSQSFKEHIKIKFQTYYKSQNVSDKEILQFILQELKLEDKTYTKNTLAMYYNYLKLQFIDYDIDSIYKELFFNTYTGTYKSIL